MNEKPEAVRLADDLETVIRQEDAEDNVILVPRWTAEDSVAELRRQHPEIERLKAENERLRRDAERYRRLLNWLIKTGLLTRERCRIDSPASYGDWWILRKPKVIEAGFVGYGETEDAAIDAAMEPATEPAIRARGEVPR